MNYNRFVVLFDIDGKLKPLSKEVCMNLSLRLKLRMIHYRKKTKQILRKFCNCDPYANSEYNDDYDNINEYN